ncbi:unnamed protein product [Hermetia illucens]|uniref:Uncharacterized protein n=1 Tax=Hermetia illucens TaxID=343691 RepID=A0A7R8UP40_HERIL|nr:unnamed protein product [Hermetia illucens]
MDDELNALLKLREIQDKVVTLRTETPPIYGKYLKEEASLLLKNVIECEVVLGSKPVKEPKLIDINVNEYKTKADVSFPALNERINNLAKCLKYYRK